MKDNEDYKVEDPIEEEGEGQGFLEHLEELRKRIIYAVLGVAAGCIVATIFIDFIIESIILLPALKHGLDIQNLKPMGQPILYFKVIVIAGIIMSFPFLLFQLWKFVAPGLYKTEKSWVRAITFFTSLCFMIGVAFAYFVMIPSMLSFAASFGSELIKNQIDVNEHLSFMIMMILAAGLFFELPMVSFILSRMGILTPETLKKYRRHAIVIILVLAAMITPSPDPVNQLIVATPIYVLYEISIFIARAGMKRYNKGQEQE